MSLDTREPLYRIRDEKGEGVIVSYCNGIVSEIYVKRNESYQKDKILIKIEENKGKKRKATNQDFNEETRSKKRMN